MARPNPTKGKQSSHQATDSYYTVIRGKKYDRRMLELAEGLTKGRGDGRISVNDAKNLLRVVKDANSYSPTEKATMEYIRKHYKFTKEGDEYFRAEIRKWAAGKGKKKAAAKPKNAAASQNAEPRVAEPISMAPAAAAPETPAYEPHVPTKKSSPVKEILIGLLLLLVIAAAFYFFAFKTSCGKNLFNREGKSEAAKTEVPAPATQPVTATPPSAAETTQLSPDTTAAKPSGVQASPELKAAVEKTQLIFIAEQTKLTPWTLKKIDALAPKIKSENIRIQLTGHTCSWGPKELNQKLSEKRAEIAKAAFVARGVPAENIETRGVADAETIGDQKTVAGRVASRRVTFKVLP